MQSRYTLLSNEPPGTVERLRHRSFSGESVSPMALESPTGNRWKGISSWVIVQLPCQLDGRAALSFISSHSHHNNHRLGLVSTWMVDCLGIPGAVSFFASPGACSCVCVCVCVKRSTWERTHSRRRPVLMVCGHLFSSG